MPLRQLDGTSSKVPLPWPHPRARGLWATEEANVLGAQGASIALGRRGARGQVRWGPDPRGHSEPLVTSGPFLANALL